MYSGDEPSETYVRRFLVMLNSFKVLSRSGVWVRELQVGGVRGDEHGGARSLPQAGLRL